MTTRGSVLAGCDAGLAGLAVHIVDEREGFETITRFEQAGATDSLVAETERLVE